MAVPKASIYKYGAFVFWQYDVGVTWEFSHMDSESKAKAMKIRANDQFRFGVL